MNCILPHCLSDSLQCNIAGLARAMQVTPCVYLWYQDACSSDGNILLYFAVPGPADSILEFNTDAAKRGLISGEHAVPGRANRRENVQGLWTLQGLEHQLQQGARLELLLS